MCEDVHVLYKTIIYWFTEMSILLRSSAECSPNIILPASEVINAFYRLYEYVRFEVCFRYVLKEMMKEGKVR